MRRLRDQDVPHVAYIRGQSYLPTNEYAIAMDLHPAADLCHAYLKTGATPISDREIPFLVDRMEEVLHHLSQVEVCHFDLKPENLLWDPQARDLTVVDFGHSREVDDPDVFDTTLRFGTTWWRSPEIVLKCVPYTNSSDFFSWACIIYELFTGEPLFRTSNSSLDGIRDHLGQFALHFGLPAKEYLQKCNPGIVKNCYLFDEEGNPIGIQGPQTFPRFNWREKMVEAGRRRRSDQGLVDRLIHCISQRLTYSYTRNSNRMDPLAQEIRFRIGHSIGTHEVFFYRRADGTSEGDPHPLDLVPILHLNGDKGVRRRCLHLEVSTPKTLYYYSVHKDGETITEPTAILIANNDVIELDMPRALNPSSGAGAGSGAGGEAAEPPSKKPRTLSPSAPVPPEALPEILY